jgi:hypothetical protein
MSQQTVTITEPKNTGLIYYTLDGTAPSVFSTPYAGPITVNASKTVNAIAVAEHDAGSAEATAAYAIVGSPLVLPGPATAINTTNATLNAFVNTLGAAGSYYFQYGTSSTAFTSSTATAELVASAARVQVVAKLSALKAKTTYYFRVVVSSAGGVTKSGIVKFTTG